MAARKQVNGLKHRKAPAGQNFLREARIAERIVDALGDVSARTVLEIGPGPGILTELLARRAGRLVAVELDRVLTAQLRMRFAREPNVEIIEGNILDVSLAGLLRTRTQPLAGMAAHAADFKLDVIGNLPYYITSDILLHLLAQHAGIERLVIMVQKEVADRIAASPRSRDYGLLSATVQLHGEVEKLFAVAPGAFQPSPKVTSAVLRITVNPKWSELGVERAGFLAFLKLSFGQKRKKLANNLKLQYSEPAIRQALQSAGIPLDIRAEALDLGKMAGIYRALDTATQA
ncbi:MAG: ribosomal RNA small subunit methyltransferase A [Acidobacteria bacterium]|nr:ribosomal RNA small subunit methyltransferase A [Acidobacteriota bacterium]